MFGMTAMATGGIHDGDKGWRVALRYALGDQAQNELLKPRRLPEKTGPEGQTSLTVVRGLIGRPIRCCSRPYKPNARSSLPRGSALALGGFGCSARWRAARKPPPAISTAWSTFPPVMTCLPNGCPWRTDWRRYRPRVDLIPEHELNPHLRPYVLAEAIDL